MPKGRRSVAAKRKHGGCDKSQGGLTIAYIHPPSLAQAWKLRGEDFRRQVEDDARLQMAGLTARVKVRAGRQSLRLPVTPSVGLKTFSLMLS